MPKILIVDDEPFIRMLIMDCLEDFAEKGVQLISADNGKVALEMILQEKPDLVFLDVMLPGMNGYEVCRTAKKEHDLTDVKIVMLSAKGQEFDRQKGDDVGADMYMTKPFLPKDLIETVKIFLGDI